MNLGLLIIAAPIACVFVVSIVMAARGPRRPDPFGYLAYEPEDAELVSEQDLADEVEAWLLAREDFR